VADEGKAAVGGVVMGWMDWEKVVVVVAVKGWEVAEKAVPD
jgi:hypothetical protein